MKTYFRVLTYAKPLGWLAPQYLIYALFQTVFSVITLGVLTPVLNVLFMVETDAAEIPESIPDFYLGLQYFKDVFNYYFLDLVQEDRFLALQFVCGILIVSIFLSNLFKYLLAVISAIVRANVISNLRNALYDRLINMHIGYYTEERKGNIMSKVMADVQEVENTVVNSLKVVVKEPLMLIGYFVALFFISAKLTGITLIILPLSGFIISYIAISIKKRAIKSQETIGNISNILEETIGGMRIIKAFNAILFSKKRFEGEVDVYAKVNVSMQKRQALSSPTSEFLGVFVVVAVLLIGGSMILGGESELSAGSFITFIAIYSQLLVPAKALSTAFSNVQRGLASAERIFGIIDLEPAIKDKSTAKKLVEFKRELSFKNVSFAYGEEKVLNNININIQKEKQ